ncbi:pre-mRNA cleavage complex 2 protein Pcf11 [Pleurodeles waltl]|uniref:pre-mRNA cleavage complex 2 protein Pcf11 n=1 Tax=Pleurodeles waltl TaxID=8319 RepID=UPI0037093A24
MEAEDACRDYQSSLEDLTFNSKPHINMLTILAEENLPFARDIVALIEAQIAKAPTAEKLPVMYLMDSIVKNVGREYLDAFSKNLVPTFVNVFEKVEENTRKSLFKLRSTWDEIFPSKKLYALDVRVNSLDPAWPIKPLPPNVNTSSIHVNPKFLSKTPEEPPAPVAPIIPAAAPVIPAPLNVPEIQKNLTQEQMIRQQLLAKQKQLLELQQKKLELELEQTKAQLAVSLGAQQGTGNVGSASTPTKAHLVSQSALQATVKTPHVATKATHVTTKATHAVTKVTPPVTAHPEKNRPLLSPQPQEDKGIAKDPRLSRLSPHLLNNKDQGHKKEAQVELKTSKNTSTEKCNSTKQDKAKVDKIPKREMAAHETKSKSLSPQKSKSSHPKDSKIQEGESTKSIEIGKRDPRLRKHQQGGKEDDKERRKSIDKKEEHSKSSDHRSVGGRAKVNGIVQKHDANIEEFEKSTGKMLRSSTRKRTRSRSPKSRSPLSHSPKRRDRRSPKRRPRSISPPQSKAGKPRHSGQKTFHFEEFPARDERNSGKRSLKQDSRDSRRLKKTHEERQETLHQHSARSTSEPKENLENWQGSKPSKRWKSGWEESKNLPADDHQTLGKTSHPRRRDSWQSDKTVVSPRTPKPQHRLSVDANLQIPKELTSASKGDLLKKANDRLASGEITQDEFLVVAHKIRQLFQYKEEKQRYDAWDSPTEEKGGMKKDSPLSIAESTYYKHKAQLKRTQVHHFSRSDLTPTELFDCTHEDIVIPGREINDKHKHSGRLAEGSFDRPEKLVETSRRLSPASSNRPYRDNLSPMEGRRRIDEQGDINKGARSSKNFEQKLAFDTWSDSVEFRNSPKHQGRSVQEFPTPERDVAGFRDYDHEERIKFGPTDSKEEKKLPFEEQFSHKRHRFENPEKATYIGSPDSRFGSQDTCKTLSELTEVGHRLSVSPLHHSTRGDGLPNTDFEVLSDHHSSDSDDPLAQDSVRFDGELLEPSEKRDLAEKKSLQVQRFDKTLLHPVGSLRLESIAGQTPRFEGTSGPLLGVPGQLACSQRFDGVTSQAVIPQRFEGMSSQQLGIPALPIAAQQYDGTPGPQRFEGAPGQPVGAQGFGVPPCLPVGPPRFDGPPGQPIGPQRFDGAAGQPLGPRFDVPPGQQLGPQRFDIPPGQPFGPPRFGVGQGQPAGPLRFQSTPGQPGVPPRFEGAPGHLACPPRFETRGPPSVTQRFGPPRFEGAPGQPVCPPRFDGPPGQPPRFDGIPGQPVGGMRFEGPPAAGQFERPPGQPLGTIRLDGPRFETHPPLRFDSAPMGTQGIQRFDGPLGHTGPRFESTNIPRFDTPPTQPRFDGLHGQQSQRFERPLGQPTAPRFDGPIGQQTPPRFDAPVPVQQPSPNRFGLQGPRYENSSAVRLNTPHYGQPPHIFSGPFQRFDLPQVPNFTGPPPSSGTQTYPNLLNRPPPPHYFGVPTSVPMGSVPPQTVPVHSGMTQPVHFNPAQTFLPSQDPGQFGKSQPGPPPFPYSENHLGQLDVNELFSKLLSTGILKSSQTESSSEQLNETAKPPNSEEEEEEDDQSEDPSIPDLTNFAIEDLRQRYDSVINRLYTGIQCYSCGMRFTAKQTDVYADHLDWHYRQNRTEKDFSRKITHRRWYYGLTDWIEFEEIADLEERAKSLFFEKVHEEVILKTQEAVREKEFQSVPAGRSAVVESCDICQEQFEQYWDEEEEEWHLKNAIRVDEQIYHPSCYEDYKNTSSFLDCTPSPSKTLIENPLNVMLNIVKQELEETLSTPEVSSPKIKEEPKENPTGCTEESKSPLTEIKTEPEESKTTVTEIKTEKVESPSA